MFLMENLAISTKNSVNVFLIEMNNFHNSLKTVSNDINTNTEVQARIESKVGNLHDYIQESNLDQEKHSSKIESNGCDVLEHLYYFYVVRFA